jgi:hypothetical protein
LRWGVKRVETHFQKNKEEKYEESCLRSSDIYDDHFSRKPFAQ